MRVPDRFARRATKGYVRAMVDASLELDSRRQRFVTDVVHGIPPVLAAERAGYEAPEQSAHNLMRAPAILAAIHQRVRAKLVGEIGPAAIFFLYNVMVNKDGNWGERVRVDAAKTLADRAGIVAKTGQQDGPTKDIHDMTGTELRSLISDLARELGDRATPVNAPVPAVTPPDLVDLID